MSFMFNFEPPVGVPLTSDSQENQEIDMASRTYFSSAPEEDNMQLMSLPAREVTEFLDERLINKFDFRTVHLGGRNLKVVDTGTLEQKLLEDKAFSSLLSSGQLYSALSLRSDLIAGVYEGGLKVWECSVDLAEFLSSHPLGTQIDLKGKSVLELGCGSGLPGLYCCKCGPQKVDFQDYNEEILKLLTHTNVVCNLSEEETTQCRYFAGDWGSFSRLAQEELLKYDIILAAETIYNTKNYLKLHEIFRSTLAEDGIIFVAAKTYYFGVGGSTEAFIEYVGSQNCFSVDTVHTVGKGVPRKILALRHLSN